MNRLLIILFLVLIMAENIWIFKTAVSWVSPAVLFSVIYSVQLILTLAFLTNDIGSMYYGLFWISAGIASFGLGTWIANRKEYSFKPDVAPVRYEEIFDTPRFNLVLGTFNLLSMALPISQIYCLGFKITDIFHLQTLLKLNTTAAYDRYITHQAANSLLQQLLLIIVYLLPIVGGWNFVFVKKRYAKLNCAATLISPLFVLFTQNAKAGFIGSVFLWLSGYLTGRIYRFGPLKFPPVKKIGIAVSGFIIFLSVNYISFFFRAGTMSRSIFYSINKKFLNYALGQIPAFNDWFSHHVYGIKCSFGLKTFFSISNTLGILKREQGIYTEKYKTIHLDTNVYTAFRPLIEDFTWIGALLVLFLFGILAGYSLKRILDSRSGILDLVVVTGSYFYIFYSFITSSWAYASYTAAVCLFYGYLSITKILMLRTQKKNLWCGKQNRRL